LALITTSWQSLLRRQFRGTGKWCYYLSVYVFAVYVTLLCGDLTGARCRWFRHCSEWVSIYKFPLKVKVKWTMLHKSIWVLISLF